MLVRDRLGNYIARQGPANGSCKIDTFCFERRVGK